MKLHGRSLASLLPCLAAAAAVGAAWSAALDVGPPDGDGGSGDMQMRVELDAGQQSGQAQATVRIHAGREVVWASLTSCAGALEIVPGLAECEVLETAPDGSWQRIRHVLDHSWYLPRLVYELRATYDRPASVRIERVAGDLRELQATWVLEADGADTIGHYRVTLDPGFWVPHWVLRAVLKHDLPRMLRALRRRAESAQAGAATGEAPRARRAPGRPT